MSTDGENERGLGRRMAEGTAWVVLLRFSIRSLGVLSTVILARLLEPSDYGLIAIATLLAASVELLSAFNFDTWLIRHKAPERPHYDTVWTLTIIAGAATAAALWLLAGPMSAFFDEPRLGPVVRVLAVAMLVSSLRNVGVVDFQRELRFDRDFAYLASVKVGAFVVTVSLGFLLRNYWALAAGIVTSHLLSLLQSYRLHPYRPSFSLRHWREAFDFGKWLLVGNLLGFVYLRADTFILGKLAGNQVLGLYTVAREIANLATTELVVPIRKVMFPGYSRMQDDIAALRRSFIDGLGLIMLVGVPFAVGISLVADPLIRVMLGEKWIGAIPLMQVLAIYSVSSIGMANQWPVLLALGKTRVAAALLAIAVAVLLPSFWYAADRYGALGGTYALGVANWVLFLAGMIVVRRYLGFSWLALLAVTWRMVISTVALSAAVIWLQQVLREFALSPAVVLVVCVLAGVFAYAGTNGLLWLLSGRRPGPERAVLDFAREKLAARNA